MFSKLDIYRGGLTVSVTGIMELPKKYYRAHVCTGEQLVRLSVMVSPTFVLIGFSS